MIQTVTKILALLVIGLHCQFLMAESNVTNRQDKSVLDRRIEIERTTHFKPFVLTPHKPNYLLPYTYNAKPNQAPFEGSGEELDNEEIKFQFSIKFPIVEDLFGEGGILYFAYTNLSFWQAYNRDASSPFRETTHEPELFFAVPNDLNVFGFKNRLNILSIVHQSNGRSDPLSRSWNRIYANFIFERGNFYFSIRPWIRIDKGGDDDNPDIQDYLGHGDFRAVYATGKHTASIMLRNTFDSDNKGAFELNYSYPMSRRAKWFFQIFEGYGESLIDYNVRTKRIGIGVALTDWL
jgi:phospholipase A1